MPQAIGDPEELRRFAYSLNSFIDLLDESVRNLSNGFSSLGDTWQDEQRVRFEEDFNVLKTQLSQFSANAEDQVVHLNSLAGKLEIYLQS